MTRYRFDQIAENSTAKKKPEENDRDRYIGLEHLDPCALEVTRWGAEVTPKGDKLLMKKGDVLFGRRRAYQKKVGIAPFDGIFSAHGMVLRPKTGVVDPAFFPFFISSDTFLDEAIRVSVGSLSPTANWKDLRTLEFDLPSPSKQRELADILSEAERLKRHYRNLLMACDDVVKSQFVEMFGDPAVNSHGLPINSLSNLGTLERGKSKHRPRNAPELRGGPDGPYPLIQTGDIANAGLHLDTYGDTYTELGLQQSRMWPKGTLCITIAANIAQTSILAIDACFPDSVVGFTPKVGISNVFLHYWFSFFQGVLEEQAPQAAQKNINLRILSNLGVITPAIELQGEFTDFVLQVDKSKFK